jgi:hypothetical protein
MEQESDLLHLFGQHSLLLFILGALLLMGLLFAVGIFVGRRSERRIRLKTRENDPGGQKTSSHNR